MVLKKKSKVIIFVILIIINIIPITLLFLPSIKEEGSWKFFLGNDENFYVPLDISSNGKYIVAGGPVDQMYLFDSSSSQPIWSYRFDYELRDVSISDDGSYIVAATSTEYKVFLFHKSSPTPIWNRITGFPLKKVDISSNGDYIVAAADQLYLFHRSSEVPIWTFSELSNMESVKISSDGYYITAANHDKIFYFERTSSTPLWSYTHSTSDVNVDISSDGEFCILGGASGMYLFNSSIDDPKFYMWETDFNYVTSLAMSSDANQILAGGLYGSFYLFENKASVPTIEGDTLSRGLVAISAEGNYFVIGCYDGNFYFYNKHQSEPTLTFQLNSNVFDVAISSEGTYFAATTLNYLYVISKDNPVIHDGDQQIIFIFYLSLGVILALDAIVGITYFIKRKLKSVEKDIKLKREEKEKESKEIINKLDKTFIEWGDEKEKKKN